MPCILIIYKRNGILFSKIFELNILNRTFVALKNTVVVAQLVRVLVCGAEGRGFEPHQPPLVLKAVLKRAAFFV